MYAQTLGVIDDGLGSMVKNTTTISPFVSASLIQCIKVACGVNWAIICNVKWKVSVGSFFLLIST